MALRKSGGGCLDALVRSTRPAHRIQSAYSNAIIRGIASAHSTSGLKSDETSSWQSRSRPKTALFFPGTFCYRHLDLIVDTHDSRQPNANRYVHPGQGVQRTNMIGHFAKIFPSTIKPLIELLDHTIAQSDIEVPPPFTGSYKPKNLSEIMDIGPAPELTATPNAQPAILFTSVCILKVLQKDFGLDVAKYGDYFLGHSLGEFTALVAAGIMSLEDAITLTRRRGIAMANCVPAEDRDDAGMYAVICPPQHMPDLITAINRTIQQDNGEIIPKGKFVQIANHNTSSQIVLSGHKSAIRPLMDHVKQFSGFDPRALKLNVSAPFHSPLMAPAAKVVEDILSKTKLNWEGRNGEVVGNVTARLYTSERELREILPTQAVEKVRWLESIRYLEDELGVERLVGFGPDVRVGRGLVKRDVKGEVYMVAEGMNPRELEDTVRFFEGQMPAPPEKKFGPANRATT